MVSTHSQYICPDTYLSPIPSSFDAGASPLALLEKTCLSVGHPDPPGKNGKTILPASDKSSPTKKDGGSQSSPDKSKNSASPGFSADSKLKKELSSPASKSDRAASVGGAKTDENGNKTKDAAVGAKGGSRPTSAPTEPGTSTPGGTTQPIPPSLPSLPTPSRATAFPSAYPGLPHGFPHPFASHAGFPHGFPFAMGAYPGMPGMPGMGSFPRPGGPCLDINCKTCPPSPMATGRPPCPLGCAHCTPSSHAHDLSSALWLNSYSSLFHGMPPPPTSLFPSLPLPPSSGAPQLPGSFPSAAALQPHACSWVTAEGICKKSFASSEDLLQHVRSHTTSDPVAASSAAATTSAAVSRPSAVSLLSSPGGGRLSPRSAYLSAALRYHPYGKPNFPMGPPTTPFPPFNYAALSSLYAGQRLPGSLPHP